MTDVKADTAGNWQQQAIENLLHENITEQRRRRRWGIFFKIIYLLIFLGFIYLLFSGKDATDADRLKPHVGLVDIEGMIFAGSDASADNVVTSLEKAMKDPKTVAVIMRINSPGGSPVQADYIYNNIQHLKKKFPKKKVYAVCSDICASAAYYIAAASDKIYADPSSIVGSIGVLLNGFGFEGAMEKVGVQRRLITAGNEKGFLDPFSPLKATDVAKAQEMLNTVHHLFIADVKKGRGNRLKDDPELFSGMAWTGVKAKELGLVDGFASTGDVARDVIQNTTIVDYTKKYGFFDQFSKNIGASFSENIMARFGLEGNLLQ